MHINVHYMNILVALVSSAFALGAQPVRGSSASWASLVGQRFEAKRDVVYRTVQGKALHVDLYVPYDRKPGPTVLYIHGGGWQTGSKEQYVLWYLPYLELGLRVVAVQYRLSGDAAAPAAVEDCACAFEWLAREGAQYGVDPASIVITGGSAGGHLALLTAFQAMRCPDSAGAPPRASAVINYYGPTDLSAMLHHRAPSLRKWLGAGLGAEALAKRLSPLTWVRAGLPPVLTLHGDGDRMVPYEHAEKLHRALTAAGVSNELVTIHGGAHGRHTWADADTLTVQRSIERFLRVHQMISEEGSR